MISIASSSSSSSTPRKKPRPGPKIQPQTKWRTGAQERIYGRRLLDALRSTRNPSSQPPAGPRAIKEAADSALALTAKGQSRWSRAILSGRWRPRRLLLKAGGKIRRRRRPRSPGKATPHTGTAAGKGKKVRDRLRLLARLVPGCRKISTPNLLDETADYVAALEMQVKAMRALANALSAASLSSPPPRATASEAADASPES